MLARGRLSSLSSTQQGKEDASFLRRRDGSRFGAPIDEDVGQPCELYVYVAYQTYLPSLKKSAYRLLRSPLQRLHSGYECTTATSAVSASRKVFRYIDFRRPNQIVCTIAC